MINKRIQVGERIRKIRLQKGLTQENLAEKICEIQNSGRGGNPQTVSRIENAVNDFGIDTLLAVAEALEVSPQNLLSDEEKTGSEWKEFIVHIMSRNEQRNQEQFQELLARLELIRNTLEKQG